MERKIEVGKTYKHFKGGKVHVLYIAKDSEILKDLIVYEHNNQIWVRPYDMFNSLSTNTINIDNYFHIEKDNNYTHGILVTDTYVILGTYNVFKSNIEVCQLLKETAILIKSNESNFFVALKQ